MAEHVLDADTAHFGRALLGQNAGDGFTMFQGCALLQDEVMLDNQVLINYITQTLDGVVGEAYADPYGEGRIVAVPEAPEA